MMDCLATTTPEKGCAMGMTRGALYMSMSSCATLRGKAVAASSFARVEWWMYA